MSFDWTKQDAGGNSRIPDANPPIPQFAPTIYVNSPPPPAQPAEQVQNQYEQIEELIQTEEDEEYYNSLVLNDARLRLVQGSLYEKIMNHNIFDGYDADPIAIKNVEREIKKYARERMEIMLGMRQEKQKTQVVQVQAQFTDMEVSILKALVSKGTKGQSSNELNTIATQPSQSLNSISSAPKQALAPLTKSAPTQQKPAPAKVAAKPKAPQPAPEAVDEPASDEPPKSIHEMNEEERAAFFEKNRQKYKTVKATGGLPMPSPQTEMMQYAAQAQNMSRVLAPHEQSLLGLINRDK